MMRDFLTRPRWRIADYAALIASVLLSLWLASPYLFPASGWIELHRIEVSDAVSGEMIPVSVSRTLHRGTEFGRYEVAVYDYPSRRPVCHARRAVPYRADATISPDTLVALKWWAYSEDGECERWTPEPGQYFMTTRHCWVVGQFEFS